MEYEGTKLDYSKHCRFRDILHNLHTVKQLNSTTSGDDPDNPQNMYLFYDVGCGLASIRDNGMTWVLTAPNRMYLWKNVAAMTVETFFDDLVTYLSWNPVMCWNELLDEFGTTSVAESINALFATSPYLLVNGSTYACNTQTNYQPKDDFSLVVEWLYGALRQSAAGSVPMSALVTTTAQKRICEFVFTDLNDTELTLRFVFAAYGGHSTTPWYNATQKQAYGTLAEALNGAASQDQIFLRTDYSLANESETTLTIPANVTVVIPNLSGTTAYPSGNNTRGRLMGGAAYTTLVIPMGYTLVVNGTFLVEGDQQSWYVTTGERSGDYGFVYNNGSIITNSGGKCYLRGLIGGAGVVTLRAGCSLYTPLPIYDWRGGTATYNAQNSNVWPFQFYDLSCLKCVVSVYAGASLYGVLFVSIGGYDQTVSVCVMGSAGLLNITSRYVLVVPVGNRHLFNINGVVETKDITVGLSINSASVNITTSGKVFPMNMDISVGGSCEFIVTNKIKFLPGRSMLIANNGTLTMASGGSVFFYAANDYSQTYYYHERYEPYDDLQADAILRMNGTVTTNGNVLTSDPQRNNIIGEFDTLGSTTIPEFVQAIGTNSGQTANATFYYLSPIYRAEQTP